MAGLRLNGTVIAKALGQLEVWFVTGSQDLYGAEALEQVAHHSGEIVDSLGAEDAIPVRVVAKPVVKSPDSIRQVCLEANAAPDCVGVIAWMHTFSPAKMWIAGLGALQKPLLHLHTQFNRDLPWAEIDMDFMNLNQSAHGDREFGFIRTRMRLARKTVVGHWRDPRSVERIATWARAAARLARGAGLKRRPLRRQHAPRRRHRGRQGRGADPARHLGQRLRRRRSRRRRCAAVPDADVDRAARRLRGAPTTSCRSCARAASAASRCATRRGSRRASARFLDAGGFRAFTDTFEDLHGLPQLPGLAVQRLMADGYGFGGEGDWKTAALVRIAKVMATGLDGGTSFMEDYTYHLAPGGPKVLGAHMLEICPSIAAAKPSCEIHPLGDRRQGRPGAARVHGARPARPSSSGSSTSATASAWSLNEVDVVPPDEELPQLPVARARLAAAARSRDGGRGLARRRRPAPHGASARRSATEVVRPILPRSPASSSWSIDERDAHLRRQEGASLEPGVPPPGATA